MEPTTLSTEPFGMTRIPEPVAWSGAMSGRENAGMTMASQQSSDKRTHILTVAGRLFLENGFAGTSMGDIAKAGNRKGVVEGKSVSEREDVGGSGVITKKKNIKEYIRNKQKKK